MTVYHRSNGCCSFRNAKGAKQGNNIVDTFEGEIMAENARHQDSQLL